MTADPGARGFAPGRQPGERADQSPWPLVRLREQPMRWLANKVAMLLAAAVAAYVGQLIVVAVYYLLFEVNPTMTALWHHAVPSSAFRHDLRNNGEGLLGGLLAQAVVWNHFKRRRRAGPVDRLELACHVPNLHQPGPPTTAQLLATPLLVLLYAAPGFLAAFAVAAMLRGHAPPLHSVAQPHLGTGRHAHLGSLWTRTQATVAQDWQQKLRGYGASLLFGHRPARASVDHLQCRFAARRLRRRRRPRWYHTPTFHARYHALAADGSSLQTQNPPRETVLISVLGVTGIALAVFGWYVLTVIAAA
jgi:hypothetical protein